MSEEPEAPASQPDAPADAAPAPAAPEASASVDPPAPEASDPLPVLAFDSEPATKTPAPASAPAFGAHSLEASPEPPLAVPQVIQPPQPVPSLADTFKQWIRDYFVGDVPSFGLALVPFCFLSMLLFTRHPTKTNFIFDEQEALLANPYVRSVADAHPKFRWIDAFHRDFWGLGPERSIGSYRPIPDLVWRALWALGARDQTPFLHHWVNVLLHGVNGALVCVLAHSLTKRRGVAWIAGAAFTASAVLTEAVSGVVGIADVLGATGTLLALLALTLRWELMFFGVIGGTLFGLYSKESALCCVPLVPLGALLLSPNLHPKNPQRWFRATLAFVAAGGAFVFYVYMRRWAFPTVIPNELSAEANAGKPLSGRIFAGVLRWYAQPILPKDPLNNPLVNATPVERIAGALRVWFRGLTQVVFPWTLSGDYSAPQEPIPKPVVTPEILLGAIFMVLPFPLALWLGVRAFSRFKKLPPEPKHEPPPTADGVPPAPEPPSIHPPDPTLVVAFGALWAMISYFPVSNIPVLLPTVRAERFWYFPVIGTSLMIGVLFGYLLDRVNRRWLVGGCVAFFLFQGVAARRHANDYTDDLSFWDATRKAVPRSAKAHLNYSVMKGARGDLQTRLESNRIALDLAPEWPMASVYYGDTLCRLHRAREAWPFYVKGFELAPNDVNLIALGLQCLWDEKVINTEGPERTELEAMKERHPGSWLEYLGRDIIDHGDEHNGVDPKYRPRGYNEGPKD